MLAALLRKDVRMMRLILLLVAIGIPACVLVTALVCFTTADDLQPADSTAAVWSIVFDVSTQFCFGLTYFGTVLLAGSIIAGERQDGSVDFLACLPPLRKHHLASKLAVVAGFTAMSVLVLACLTALADAARDYAGAAPSIDRGLEIVDTARLLLGGSGVAWAISSISRTPLSAILAGLVTPMLAVPLIELLLYAVDVSLPLERSSEYLLNAVAMFGLAGFASGSVWYLLRREA